MDQNDDLQEPRDETTASPIANIILWLGVGSLITATIFVLFTRSTPKETPDPTPNPPINTPEPTKTWNQTRFESIIAEASADYRRFIVAEREDNTLLRRRYFNRARTKLQAMMDEINELPESDIKDETLIQRAAELLSDLSKKAHTVD